MKRGMSLLKNTIIIAFGSILPKFASLITLPIITAKLTKAEYGTYDLISTLVSLLLPIVTLQIQSAAFRFLIEYDKDMEKRKQIIATIFIFVMTISMLVMIVLFCVLYKINIITRVLIIVYFLADILLTLLQQIARGLHKNKLYSASAVIVSAINMILILLIVQVVDAGLNGVIMSTGIATCITTIILLNKLNILKEIKIINFKLEILRDLLKYSWPMIPNSLSNWVISFSDRAIITFNLGIEANAIYSVANKIPNLFTSLQGTFVMAWQENASIASKDDDISLYYTNVFDAISRIFFGIMSCLIAATPLLFVLLIRGEYDEAYLQMPILYLGLLFSGIASFIGGIYVAVKQTKSIGITTIVAAIINIIVNILLIKFIGIYAGSISTMVSYLCLAIYRMKNIQKFVEIKYKYKKILLYCLLLVIMSILCYQRIAILNIINIVIAIIGSVIINRDIIKQFLLHFNRGKN